MQGRSEEKLDESYFGRGKGKPAKMIEKKKAPEKKGGGTESVVNEQ